jgi:indolepyruvate ferredoxin oxidoreductase beta subunit
MIIRLILILLFVTDVQSVLRFAQTEQSKEANDMSMNCILAGVGGQGTVLASKLLAQAAMAKGQSVRTAETIGMAQRGGCVVSHVRIGENMHSPMIPLHCADLIIGFEPAEAVRCLPFLKKDGTVVVNSAAIRPVTSSLGNSSYHASDMLSFLQKNVRNLIIIDGAAICEECGSPKVLNVALLGASFGSIHSSGEWGLSLDEIGDAIRARVSPAYIEMNQRALAAGAQAAATAAKVVEETTEFETAEAAGKGRFSK